jgi:hypothetical protein
VSHSGNGPCPNRSTPTDLPTIELRRRIGIVNEHFLGLAFFITDLAWAKQPDPVRACQILGNLIDQCDSLTTRIADLRQHAVLLWDLSYEESLRRDRDVA